MIGSILLCDRCLMTGGALPAVSGAASRKAARRGTIRRVRLGRTFWREGHGTGRVNAVDLCLDCRNTGAVEEYRAKAAANAERYGSTFVPAV